MFYLAHYPFEQKTWLAFTHTLTNGTPPSPIIEDSILTTALLLPAVYEADEFVNDFKLGGEQVNFLWLTYISDKETEYKLKYGYDKLVDSFSADNFPRVFDPFRQSIF
jgi:hypothetical protein